MAKRICRYMDWCQYGTSDVPPYVDDHSPPRQCLHFGEHDELSQCDEGCVDLEMCGGEAGTASCLEVPDGAGNKP
jgi:hypothetical protein